ncbi:MAG: ribbon-helix-helix protein, CopG family [Nitrospira sp.]
MGRNSSDSKANHKVLDRQRHDYVVVVKLAGSLVRSIDQEAEAEGLTRSAIIRRVLKRKYESESPVTAQDVKSIDFL